MEETEIDIRGIVGLLRRQIRLIVITFVVVMVLAAIALFAMTPRYSSSALIFVDPSSKNLLDPESSASSAASDNARVDSEVEILRSQGVLVNVVQSQNLISDPEFGVSLGLRDRVMAFLRLGDADLPTGEAALRNVLNKLQSSLKVQRRGSTYLIAVGIEAENPERAATLANAVADAYLDQQIRSKIDSVSASQATLEARLSEARDAIVRSEESFDSFIESNLDTLAAEAGTEVEQMRAELLSLTDERSDTVELAQSVNQYLSENNFQAVVASLQSDALTELENQRQELSVALSESQPNSPIAINLRDELASIEARLEAQASQEVETLQGQVSQIDASVSQLRQSIRSDLLSSDLPVDVLAQLYELQQSAELARTQYQTLLSRSSDLAIQTGLQIADSRIISRAMPAGGPSFPNKRLILLLAGIGGLCLGIGLAFLYENYIGGIISSEQAQSVLKTTSVVEVPRQKKLPGQEGSSVSSVVMAAPLSHYSEAIRRLRAAIDMHLRKKKSEPAVTGQAPKAPVIMVTSSVPAEGKSTMALSLARTYALSGLKTIIVDCDLRKPSIHQQLGLEPEGGLLDFLTGSAKPETLSNIIVHDKATGLSVLTGARRSDIPTDQLLMGKAFESLINAARKNFDIVILDTPPILPVVDGIHLLHYVDIIAFVVRWASTSQSEALTAITRFDEFKSDDTEVLAVLNQQESQRSSYLNRYSSYYQEA